MKRLLATVLILSLLAAPFALSEAPRLRIGYIAPAGVGAERCDATAAAFAYAAEQKGVDIVTLRYEFSGSAAPTAAPSAEGAAEDPAVRALQSLIEDGLDGVAAMPESMEQALKLVTAAHEAGMPIAIEGIDLSPAFPPTPDPEDVEDRPYVAAVCYGDAAAYAAARWLDNFPEAALMLHCTLPATDAAIQSGLWRALAEARYLEMTDEIAAEADSSEGGYNVVQQMYNNYTMFSSVLADSAALAEGCAVALRDAGESMPIAVINGSPEAIELMYGGAVDMVAGTPASVEGVRTFRVLYEYLTEGTLPGNETRLVPLEASVITPKDRSGWIDEADYATAYALAFPEDAMREDINPNATAYPVASSESLLAPAQ